MNSFAGRFSGVSRARFACIAGLLIASGFTTLATASDTTPADHFRRLVFMLNLDPVIWDDAKAEIEALAEGLAEHSPEQAEWFTDQTTRIFRAVAKEASVSIPTKTMQRTAGREIIERATAALSTVFLEALDDPKAAATLWPALEPEMALADPDSAARFESYLNARNEAETEKLREYIRTNYLEDFHVKFHGALRPLPMSGHANVVGPIPKPPLPPGTTLNPGALEAHAALSEDFGGKEAGDLTSYELGLVAFHDPGHFGEPGRSQGLSCASCHAGSRPNQDFFIPGLSNRPGNADVTNSHFGRFGNNRAFDPLDIPDLAGIALTEPYGRNARFETLAEVVRNVIVMEFGGEEPDQDIVDGIATFIASFPLPKNELLEPDGSLAAHAPETSKRGERVFHRPFAQMDGRSCATCHTPSDLFLDRQKHDIGSIPIGSPYAPDGKLDTPTLLGSTATAPYLHDGRLPTLRAVVEWFDQKNELALSEEEISDLTAYLEVVGRVETD